MTDLVFLPWARRGFARAIAPTRSQATRANPPITLDVSLTADSAGAVATSAHLLGPGDVVGIDLRQVLKTDPPSNSFDFEPNYLASIEFKAADLPWMFTPWTHDSNRLEPWIALIVLEKLSDDLIKSDPTRPLPFVTIASGADLPNLSQSWAWAHVQVSGAIDQADARRKLESAPESCLSRVICPRRLDSRKIYVACVVPAFEVGRKAGLGIPLAVSDLEGQKSTRFAWTAADSHFDVPVYHSWEFGTGAGGDFESLVWDLQRPSEPHADEMAGLGRVPMNVVSPSWPAVPADAPPVFFEGALQPVAAVAPTASAPAAFTARLNAALNTAVPGTAGGGDPELPLPPPLYGRWHAGRSTVPKPTDTKAWVATLNLDLGLRAAAGLGARIVEEQQESLMAAAWQQVGEIERANQLLRQGQLSRSGSVALFKSRFESMAPATLLQLAAPVASRVADRWSKSAVLGKMPKETLAAHLSRYDVSGSVLSAQFRRATRARGPLARRFGRAGAWSAALIERWNEGAISPDRGRRQPPGTFTIDDVTRGRSGLLRVCQLNTSRLGNERALAFGPFEGVNAKLAPLLESLPSTIAAVAPYPGLVEVVKRFAGSATRLQRAAQGPHVDWRDALEAIRELILLQAALFSALGRASLGVAAAADVRARFEAFRQWIAASLFPAPTQQESLRLQRQFLIDLALIDAQAGMPACASRRPSRKPKLDLEHIAAVLLRRLDPRHTISAHVKARIGMGGRTFEFHTRSDGDELEPVMAAPRFDLPMYKPLVELSPEYLLPGIQGVPRNSIGLLQSNRRFIEAFMVGLNHELASELLWREFPTDQRGTYFHHFWDTTAAAQPAADIGEISEWTGLPLGENVPAQTTANPAVLVLRGDLARRYPRVLIFMQQAKWTGTGATARRTLGTQTVQPTFRGTLPPDVTFLGFPALEAIALIGSEDPNANDPGYFLVLQEPIGELRFGLNETAPDLLENTWRDLAWPNVTVTNHHLDLAGPTAPAAPTTANKAAFGMTSDAAQMAYILLQRPVRVALHASDLIMAGAQ
ncbi:MAG: hypothetical protein A3H96_04560 [Acidobacteria bacterium RIFCSPLOWO2_02_FULL_67_36]|nr:MAG: hypothetical protein A3H96_04560 [Acidobacteria bacterium RIFCSPLOWO2_02_FULL_67_36]OFW25374.1 MAG: hypothetical protein A3G21_08455 [Acidobacteria bacterium RIFCSPLOWO2_12_FULL_66_21]